MGGVRRLPMLATVAGSMAVALAPLLPWASSGRAVRSGFALARLGRSVGLASTWPVRGLFLAVGLLPLMAALAWTAAWMGRRRLVAAVGATSGGVALVAAAVVWQAPVEAGPGPAVSAVAGTIALAGALALARSEEERWTTSTG